MRRPADQAKLLFLYLLRSSAALATESKMGAAAAAAGASSASAGSSAEAASAVAAAVMNGGGLVSSAAPSAPPPRSPPLTGHIALRVARQSDVPHIQRCNLATLPENYSANFYQQHMRQWPELALVAEHVPAEGTGVGDGDGNMYNGGHEAAQHQHQHHQPLKTEIGGGQGLIGGGLPRANQVRPFGNAGFYGNDYGAAAECPPRIVGYVLGKVDRGVVVRDYPADPFAAADSEESYRRSTNGSARNRVAPRSMVSSDDGGSVSDVDASFLWSLAGRPRARRENLGHVTSLAVLPDFRRRGLAAELMEQLHLHMAAPPYRADAVGLHVRVSNRAATRLYGGEGCGNGGGGAAGTGGMGYKVADVIRGYYQDGEDAYFMRKEFTQEDCSAAAADARQYGRVNNSRVRRALDKLRIAGGGGGGGGPNGRSALRMRPWGECGGIECTEDRDRGLLRCIPLAPDAEVVSNRVVVDDCRMEVEQDEDEEQAEQVMSGAA